MGFIAKKYQQESGEILTTEDFSLNQAEEAKRSYPNSEQPSILRELVDVLASNSKKKSQACWLKLR